MGKNTVMAKNTVATTGMIESLDHAGQGIARADGKTIFVEGGLPGERVSWLSYLGAAEQRRAAELPA